MAKLKKTQLGVMFALSFLLASVGHVPYVFAHDNEVREEKVNGDAGASSHDLVQGSHVEGHIAFLKTELGITTAQESFWVPVAEAMREDVKNLQDAERKIGGRPPDNAVGYLQNRVVFANLRADGETRFLTAFQPLYSNLSSSQRRIADELLMPGRTGGMDE
jgi:hypothetical protein